MTLPYVPPVDPTNYLNRPGDGPLRPGGSSASGQPATEDNLPSTPSLCVKRQQAALQMCRDLDAGGLRVRMRGQAYLPQAPGEHSADYDVRLRRSVFFNVFGRTVEGMVGQIFRRDPVLGDDVPQAIQEQWENIDLAGTHGDVFARQLEQDAIVAGHAAILVEYPQTGGAQTAADEIGPAGLRPYWVPIQKDNVVSWRTTVIAGRVVLTQLVLKETTQVASGPFGEAEQTRYRVFQRSDQGVVSFQLLKIEENKSVTVVDTGTYPTQDEIPIAEIVTSGRKGLFESDPPLLDLAFLNIAHYQQYSDYSTSIYKTCVPVLTLLGFQNRNADGTAVSIVVGPNTVLVDANDAAKAQYVSHDGRALDSCKQSLDDLKSDMGTLGLSMLSPSKRTAETAQAKRLDKSTEDSAMAVTSRGLENGLERAFYFHAKYLKLESGGSVTTNREFDEQTMQADMLTAWTGAVRDAGVPERFMIEAMQSEGLIDPDEKVDEIAAEMAANKAAADAQKAAEAAAQLQPTPAKAV